MPPARPPDADGGAPEAEGTTRRGPGRFRQIRWFAELDSTNRYALEQARRGVPEGLVVVADHQSAGRGRLGRTWTAPPGASLLVSVLLRPAAVEATRVTLAAGLALVDAVAVVAGVTAGLKWPNDLVVGERKLAGILAEAELGSGAPAVVVGIGCNVNWESIPDELAEIATACNLEAGHAVDRDALLDALLEHLDERLAALGSPALLADYRSRSSTLGQRVRVETPAAVVVGTAVDVGTGGELLVRDDAGVVHPIRAGDVVRLRPTAGES
jgi:BirA family transcriptional regulator, biotin operon repressor / biotin---[acetyl-CoA-carboxylase] ligase